jgi:hypothetical protein
VHQAFIDSVRPLGRRKIRVGEIHKPGQDLFNQLENPELERLFGYRIHL